MESNRPKIQKQLLCSQIINTIYLLLFGAMSFGTWKSYQNCESAAQAMLNNAGNANEESFVAGYLVMGDLAGAGALSLFSAALYLGLIISVAYALVFLAENICGYVLYAGFGRKEFSGKIRNGMKVDAIIKCILAVTVILPTCFLLFTDQWFFALAAMLPQIVVLILSVQVVRMLSKRKKGTWTEEMG